MLNRRHRLLTSNDFRAVFRGGRKMSVPGGLIAVRRTDPEAPVRCGFVVSKAVGNAVVRNVVKRRLRAACASLVTQYRGADLVVRADRHAQDVTVEVWQAVLDGALEKVVAS